MELVLVRRADVSEIMCTAYMGDKAAAKLLHAVRTFETNHRGKRCVMCGKMFGIECARAAAWWIGENLVIGVCSNCAAQPDRQLRRRIQKFELEKD
jgi:hypothetical protein